MRGIDHTFRVLHSELIQRCLDAAFSDDFPVEGRFVTAVSRGRRCWYFDMPDGAGGKRRRYVGPAGDAEITQRVEHFKTVKDEARARRRIVSALMRGAGLPRPDPMVGDVLRALAEAGLFRLRAVLVGTVAFGVYPGLLGARLPASMMARGMPTSPSSIPSRPRSATPCPPCSTCSDPWTAPSRAPPTWWMVEPRLGSGPDRGPSSSS